MQFREVMNGKAWGTTSDHSQDDIVTELFRYVGFVDGKLLPSGTWWDVG